jgi:hypothetical protein
MKKLFALLALAAAGTACQPQASPTQAVAAASTPVQAVAAVAAKPVVPPFLVQHDLTAILQSVTDVNSDGGMHIYNGFFGPAHRRIEVVFMNVRRDKAQPNLYYIQGKNRYKGLITPFVGTLQLTHLVEQPHYTKREMTGQDERMYYNPDLDKRRMYTATGSFLLREDSTHKNSGIFRGTVALDLLFDRANGLHLTSRTSRTLTRGGLAKFEGTWAPYGAASPKPVVWVDDIFTYGTHIFNNFTIGERDVDFNPKYAKLGWNTYWANDEWWATGYRDTARTAPLRRVLFTPPVASADDSVVAD